MYDVLWGKNSLIFRSPFTFSVVLIIICPKVSCIFIHSGISPLMFDWSVVDYSVVLVSGVQQSESVSVCFLKVKTNHYIHFTVIVIKAIYLFIKTRPSSVQRLHFLLCLLSVRIFRVFCLEC